MCEFSFGFACNNIWNQNEFLQVMCTPSYCCRPGIQFLHLRVCALLFQKMCFYSASFQLSSCSIFFFSLLFFVCLLDLHCFRKPFHLFYGLEFNCLLVLPKTTLVFLCPFFLIAFGWFPGWEGRNANFIMLFWNKIFLS